MSRSLVWLTTLVAVALAGIAMPAAAAPLDSQIIGSNQYFNGVLNGRQDHVLVLFDCTRPTAIPITVATSTQGAPAAGFTGTGATTITVSAVFTGSSTSVPLGTLSADNPTISVLPFALHSFCYQASSGVMTFTPEPSSPTAQPSTVTFSMFPVIPLG